MLASSLLSPTYIENSLVNEAHLMLEKDHFRIWSSLFIDTLTLTLFYLSLKGILFPFPDKHLLMPELGGLCLN
jgi:hypothetical protein